MSKKIEVKCEQCGEIFKKPIGEYNRSQKIGRKHLCSRSCAGKYNIITRLKNNDETLLRNMNDIKKWAGVSGRSKDCYSIFRPTLNSIRGRRDKKEVDLSLIYLKEVWESQKGICPYSGIKLKLSSWNKKKTPTTASLDRIDSSKGYVEGNVQFVSVMANFAKSDFTHEQMMMFCESIACHQNNISH